MKRILVLTVFWAIILVLSSISSAAEKVFFVTTDPAGTPVAYRDAATGNVVWRADYKPFGQEQSISGSLENNERFIGKEKDKETGLDYFGGRYMYDKPGRFISPDPIGPVDPWTGKINMEVLLNPQRLNAYAYGLNNPYRYVDRDGKEALALPGPIPLPIILPPSQSLTPRERAAVVSGLIGLINPITAYENAKAWWNYWNEGGTSNTNPFTGPVDKPVTIVDPAGNAIPVGAGEQVTGSPDGRWIQVRDDKGNPTGTRLDGPHNPSSHSDPRAQKPHGHVPGANNPDGTPWLPVK